MFSGYGLVVQQTFFSSIPRGCRKDYACRIDALLRPGGKFVGLFFNPPFSEEYPPFGGLYGKYKELVFRLFNVKYFALCHGSINPRQGREFFFVLEKSGI